MMQVHSHLINFVGEVTYLEGWKSIELANKIFGYNGWSCSIVDLSPDFVISHLINHTDSHLIIDRRIR